jgi:hypothetical protein
MATPHPSLFASAGVALLVGWRLYSRVRRMIGRQQLKRWRPRVTVTFFPLVLLLLAVLSLAHPVNLAALAGGAASGYGLGRYGLGLTRFEQTPRGRFYTPSAHLGIALSLLFASRVIYRLLQTYGVLDGGPSSSADFFRSPLTLAIFGLLAGYYVTYAIGLLRWARLADQPAAPAAVAASDAKADTE